MVRIIFLLCIIIAAVAYLPGQVIISGHLYDPTGNPVFLATVIVTDCQNNQIIAFANSDVQGRYQVSFHTGCDSIIITARALGYQEQMCRLAVHAIPSEQNFRLISTTLPEVTIRAQALPIVQYRDTTEYNVSSFTDSTEFSVEDVLKKLPGIRVSESGTISFNGKPVERVLLDGDDLTGTQYAITTRNVRADMISQVQAIEHYRKIHY
ncbi:MAG: carboxypeptidase regulatory-like domain-containing protein [Nitrosomonas sp.]|nr:carboxypeptidase regulatory-like domain-containing protein [Nitrosomonas sp.]